MRFRRAARTFKMCKGEAIRPNPAQPNPVRSSRRTFISHTTASRAWKGLAMTLVPLLLGLFASTANAKDEQPSARVIAGTRASLAIPAGYPGVAQSYSAEVGAQFRSGQQLTLRFIGTPNPPKVLGDDTPTVAFGPAVSWSYNVKISPRMDISPSVAVGALYGPSPETEINQVLLYLQGGLGMRLRIPTGDGSEMFIMPEVGIVPAILAPMMAVNVGFIGAPPVSVPPPVVVP